MEEECSFYIRYSDDMLVLGRDREELEDILARTTLLLEKAGLSLNQSKTIILPVEEGFDFLGYHFDKNGKAIPEKAEINLEDRLENIWLTEKSVTVQDKLKKCAEILGGWEQYFKGDRKIASGYELAVVVYMTRNKTIDLSRLEQSRKTVNNSNPEICRYLHEFWQEAGNQRMMLYEMEDFQDIADLDRDVEISNVCLGELLEFYNKLMTELTEEALVNIMQIYSDVGAFNKAAIFMDKISRFHADYDQRNQPIIMKPMDEERESVQSVKFTREQIKIYLENFAGREDTYVIRELEKNGRQKYIQVMEPLTEDVLQRHFAGEHCLKPREKQINYTYICRKRHPGREKYSGNLKGWESAAA